MNIEEKLKEFDEKFYFGKLTPDTLMSIDDSHVKEIKDFIRHVFQQQKDHYEKELKIADDRWERNEKYREQYMDGYVEEKTAWKQEYEKELKKINTSNE